MGAPSGRKAGVDHSLILPMILVIEVHMPSRVSSSGSDALRDRRLSRTKLRVQRSESLLSTLLVGDVRLMVADDTVG